MTYAELIARAQIVAFPLLAFVATVGVCALVNPRLFAWISSGSSRWADRRQWTAVLNAQYGIDIGLVRYSRLFGVAVLFGSAVVFYTRMVVC